MLSKKMKTKHDTIKIKETTKRLDKKKKRKEKKTAIKNETNGKTFSTASAQFFDFKKQLSSFVSFINKLDNFKNAKTESSSYFPSKTDFVILGFLWSS